MRKQGNFIYKTAKWGCLICVLVGMTVRCTPDPVEFKSISNVNIISNNGKTAKLKADALLYNPNKAGAHVRNVDIIVSFKDQEVAHVSEDNFVRVEGLQDFTIPLEIELDLAKIQNNWLGNLVTILQNKSIELHFNGTIKVRVHGIGYRIPVDYTEKIKI